MPRRQGDVKFRFAGQAGDSNLGLKTFLNGTPRLKHPSRHKAGGHRVVVQFGR